MGSIAKIRPTLALWGARFGFMAYGWDAGVLGGVLQTASFQSAMHVSCPDIRQRSLVLTILVPQYNYNRNDCGGIPSRIRAGLSYRVLSLE